MVEEVIYFDGDSTVGLGQEADPASLHAVFLPDCLWDRGHYQHPVSADGLTFVTLIWNQAWGWWWGNVATAESSAIHCSIFLLIDN
jgi:hypothetical protein